MDIILTIVMGLVVANAAFAGGRPQRNLLLIKQLRPVHFLTNLPVIALVLVTLFTLVTYVPFMDKNPILWILSLIFGGDGSGISNIVLSGIQWKWYALIFLPVLAFALPSLAKAEEHDFREGTRNWGHGVVRSIGFGLIHLIMLIPIGAALALIISGLWYTHQYFKGGVERSTSYHIAWNMLLVAIVFVTVIFL